MEKGVVQEEELVCYHCGDPCDSYQIIHADDHTFCCTGCRSVYEILKEADLCNFYELDEKVGKVTNQDSRKYIVLDNEEIAQEFLEFSHNGTARVTFFCPKIHCSSCIWLLEHMNRINPSVLDSRVNFLKREVTVTFHSQELSLRELAHLLDRMGYAPQIEKRRSKKIGNDVVIRLAVAGFFFGNSMLISLPEYLDLSFQLPETYRSWFGYLNILFALPVFFYSATLYFKSAWGGLRHGYINIDVPISLGIITLFVRSLIEVFLLGGSGYVDSLTGLVFFLLIGRWFQHKTYQALSFDRELASFFPIAVTKLEAGEETITRIQDLKESDVLVIRNGEMIPADATLMTGNANIDYSFVTGESVPIQVQQNEKLFAGGRQMGGPIQVELLRKVFNSHLTRLWNQQEDGESGLKNWSDRISRYFTFIIGAIALGAALGWWFIDPSRVVDVFTSILIVACPCALALSVPFSYGHTMRAFGKRGLYLRNADVIERISQIRRIVFDKTGTLSHPLPNQTSYSGKDLSTQRDMVFTLAAASLHPLSQIIAKSADRFAKVALDSFEEVPGKGVIGVRGDTTIRLGSTAWILETDHVMDATVVHLEINGHYWGRFEFRNVYRKGIFRLLEKMKARFDLHLISGDNPSERSKLEPYFTSLAFNQSPDDKLAIVRKLQKEDKDHTDVMMIGDGLNDAGALKISDVGISISDDVYQFSPASDAILDADRIEHLGRFIDFSSRAVRIVWIAFTVSFAYNFIGMLVAITGHLTPLVSSILMPISSITVVALITGLINYYVRRDLSNI